MQAIQIEVLIKLKRHRLFVFKWSLLMKTLSYFVDILLSRWIWFGSLLHRSFTSSLCSCFCLWRFHLFLTLSYKSWTALSNRISSFQGGSQWLRQHVIHLALVLLFCQLAFWPIGKLQPLAIVNILQLRLSSIGLFILSWMIVIIIGFHLQIEYRCDTRNEWKSLILEFHIQIYVLRAHVCYWFSLLSIFFLLVYMVL